MNLNEIQSETKEWQDKNFPGWQSWEALIGLQEELGELSHAHLKEYQGIRLEENHQEKAKDAIGDMVIFMMGYCNARGWNLKEIIEQTWSQVRQRSWR